MIRCSNYRKLFDALFSRLFEIGHFTTLFDLKESVQNDNNKKENAEFYSEARRPETVRKEAKMINFLKPLRPLAKCEIIVDHF